MIKKLSMSLIGFAILSVNAQTINLQGVVSNSAGKPISNAVVSLVRQKMKDTTGTDGKYLFVSTSVRKVSSIVPQMNDIDLNNGVLQFELSAQSPVKVEIFDLKGNLLRRAINMTASAGTYRFDITKNCDASKVLVIKAAIGMSEVTFRYMPLHNGNYVLSPISEVSSSFNRTGLAPIADVVDTITVTATGYKAKSVAITSLSMQQNVTLDTNATGGKNDPVPSAGCGKALNTAIKNKASNNITSSGSSRSFIINFPDNYNKDQPYRLIFGMHCMGGDAQKVAGTSDQSKNFYGIKTQADKDNIQCIYVAPQGNSNGTWTPTKDIQFFYDLQKYLKDNFCIDTSRVFSVGFSFGAMYSYALSLKYPKILRAVACNAPANWSFDPQPTNEHIPIAYIQTTGTGDPTCNWISNDAQKKGGKYCLLQHVEDNGCNTNTTIQIATTGVHKVTEFTGCKDGYPVRFMSHNGVHECNKTDQGSNFDWIPVEFWDFFKRF
jgi:poly(3-hydroxybutyrate) depolymerase